MDIEADPIVRIEVTWKLNYARWEKGNLFPETRRQRSSYAERAGENKSWHKKQLLKSQHL